MCALEKRPLAKLVLTDIAAFNVPKIALARTWKERWDTATLELSNTSITLFSSLALPPLLREVSSLISRVPRSELARDVAENLENKAVSTEVKLARLGTAFGFFLPFAAAFWAAPFFRNWLTQKRTQSANFEAMIGFGHVKAAQQPQRHPQAELAYQKNTALQVLGTGAGLGALLLLSFNGAARLLAQARKLASPSGLHRLVLQWEKSLAKKGRAQKAWQYLFDKFDLKGKNAYQIAPDAATLIFWGLPAYLGWMHGARSGNELRERTLQSLNALFWFFAAPVIARTLWTPKLLKIAGDKALWNAAFIRKTAEQGKRWEKQIGGVSYQQIQEHMRPGPQRDRLIRLKNWRYGISDFVVPIGALSAVQCINFAWTERKLKQAEPTSLRSPRLFPPPIRYPAPPLLPPMNPGYFFSG